MPASQATAGHLLRLIRTGQATTRGELQCRHRPLPVDRRQPARPALRGRLAARDDCPAASTGGRPSVHLEFDSSHAVVLAVDLDTRHGRAAVLDLDGRILAERSEALLIADGPELVLDTLAGWFPALLEKAGVDPPGSAGSVCRCRARWSSTRGLVVSRRSCPAGTVPHSGPAASRPTPTSWPRQPTPVPVLVDNDANLMALCRAAQLLSELLDVRPGQGLDRDRGGRGRRRHAVPRHRRRRRATSATSGCTTEPTRCACAAPTAAWRRWRADGAVAGQLAAIGVPTASGSDVRAASRRPVSRTPSGWPGRRAGASARSWSPWSPCSTRGS